MGSVSHTVLCVIVVLVCLSALADAQRERKNKKGKKPCKYRKEKTKECDPVENTRNLTMTLRKGGEECPQTKVLTLSCRKRPGCLYDGKSASFGECDRLVGRQAIVKSLIAEGSPEGCPATHTRLRRCGKAKRRGGRRGRGGKGKRKQGRRNRKNKRKQKAGRRGRGGRRNKMKVNPPEQL